MDRRPFAQISLESVVEFAMKRVLNVSAPRFAAPATAEYEAAYADTPTGRLTLVRAPSSTRSPESVANKHEDWKFLLDDKECGVLHDVAAPGYPIRARIRNGVDAEMHGESCHVSARSGILPRQRYVEILYSNSRSRFRTNGVSTWLDGIEESKTAERKLGKWMINNEDERAIVDICIFEMCEFDFFLRSPILMLF